MNMGKIFSTDQLFVQLKKFKLTKFSKALLQKHERIEYYKTKQQQKKNSLM